MREMRNSPQGLFLTGDRVPGNKGRVANQTFPRLPPRQRARLISPSAQKLDSSVSTVRNTSLTHA
ncbi:hypothetical protein IQ07DRAFT_584623 [Pyrenochaeta sp. DS3sAY3a]|nr:hypothetical protein IQ07DRAFT_584623 [Pyrenochaeta sp. DS3sAY3a]